MKLNNNWVLGLMETNIRFNISLNSKKNCVKSKYFLSSQFIEYTPIFTLTLNSSDLKMLYSIKKIFHCGFISKTEYKSQLKISNINHLYSHVLPFFEKNHLLSKKRIDFEKFRKIVLILSNANNNDNIVDYNKLNKLTYDLIKSNIELDLELLKNTIDIR